eukprot:366009-Chlamydomonas_euryale.AAC.6
MPRNRRGKKNAPHKRTEDCVTRRGAERARQEAAWQPGWAGYEAVGSAAEAALERPWVLACNVKKIGPSRDPPLCRHLLTIGGAVQRLGFVC